MLSRSAPSSPSAAGAGSECALAGWKESRTSRDGKIPFERQRPVFDEKQRSRIREREGERWGGRKEDRERERE